MERLIQKHIRHFYIILASVITIQLLIVLITLFVTGLHCDTFLFIFFSVMNLVILGSSIKHNLRQQFTECKTDAKVLRYTIGLLMASHMILYFRENFNWVVLMDHILITVATIGTLNYRIKTIEHLENMVGHCLKTKVLDRKEE